MTIHRLRLRWVRRYNTDADFRHQVLFVAIVWAIVFFVLIWPIFDGLLSFFD